MFFPPSVRPAEAPGGAEEDGGAAQPGAAEEEADGDPSGGGAAPEGGGHEAPWRGSPAQARGLQGELSRKRESEGIPFPTF